MPSKKSTKVVPASLDPGSLESLAFFSVYRHELGAVLAAEDMGRRVAYPTFWADLVDIEPQGRPGRAGGAVEPVGHQFICIFGAIARIEGVAAPAGRANHALGEGARGLAFDQLGTVTDTVAIPRRIPRETHRAAFRWRGVGLLRWLLRRPQGLGACSLWVGTRAVWRLPRRPSTTAPCQRDQRDGEHHQSSDGPGHLGIVQDRESPRPQKRQPSSKSPGRVATRASSVLRCCVDV